MSTSSSIQRLSADLTCHWLSFLPEEAIPAMIGTCRTFANMLGTGTGLFNIDKKVGTIMPSREVQARQAEILKKRVDGGKATGKDLSAYQLFTGKEMYCGNIRELDLENCSRDFPAARFQNCSKLERVSFKGWRERLTPEYLQEVVQHCPQLRSINLSGCTVTDKLLTALKGFINLRHLKIYMGAVTADGFEIIASNFPQLRSLELYHCQEFTNADLQKIAIGHPELLHLDISYCNKVTDNGLQALSENCKQLEVLILDGCANVFGESITSGRIVLLVNSCPNLIELGLMFSHIDDEVLQAIAIKLNTTLQVLNLAHCSRFSDNGIQALIKKCIQLRRLNLEGCEQLTDQGLAGLGGCVQLEDLNLKRCLQTTDKTLMAMAGCQNLRTLNLENCQKVNGSGFTWNAPNVQILKFWWCSLFSDEGLILIGKNFPHLQEIDLAECFLITDVGMEGLFAGCKDLSMVRVAKCSKLTDRTLQSLSKNNPRGIRNLDLKECSLISAQQMKAIRREFRKITITSPSGTLLWQWSKEDDLVDTDLTIPKLSTPPPAQGGASKKDEKQSEVERKLNVGERSREDLAKLIQKEEDGLASLHAQLEELQKEASTLEEPSIFNRMETKIIAIAALGIAGGPLAALGGFGLWGAYNYGGRIISCCRRRVRQ